MSIIKPAQTFIADTATLLGKIGFVLEEESKEASEDDVVRLTRRSIFKKNGRDYEFWLECWWWYARNPSDWEPYVDLRIFQGTNGYCGWHEDVVARMNHVKTAEEVVEFLQKYRPDTNLWVKVRRGWRTA